MNFRHLLLAAILGLSACNGSETSKKEKEADSTFSDLANAKAELEKVNAQVSALQVKLRDGLSAVTMAQVDYDRLVKEAAAEAIKRDAASKELVRLAGEDGKGGAIKNATDDLLKLQGAADIAANTLKSAQDELAILKGNGKGSIFEAEDALKKLTGDKGTLTEATKTLEDRKSALLKLIGDPTKDDIGDITRAKATLDRLIGENGKGGEVGDAEKKLAGLKKDIETTRKSLELATQTLETLQGKDGKGGDIAGAQKKLADLGVELDTARQDLATARDEWKWLRGDDGKGGEIALEQKKLDDLIKLAGDKAEEIRKAGLELDGIKLEAKTITDAATLDAARIRAQAAFDAGRFDDAGKFLTDAGLNDEAIELYKKAGKNEKAGDLLAATGKSEEAIEQYKKAGKIDKAAALLTAAGKLEDAYRLFAPEDKVITDANPYGAATNGSIALEDVDETPSVKRHSMQLDGKTVWFTAKAGHLVAYAQKDKNNPDAKRDPQAAVFYMSYTRDDLPKETRPVTFFFNGGPGESSIWLHLGAWAPWRLKVDQPNVPANTNINPPKSYPFVDNPESLLDKTDLVFVDPIGAGFSQAISSDVKAHVNRDFWGVDADAKVMRDFVTRYINVNNRQSSPKYLYGESYGGGVRVPVLANLLIDAGTENFDKDMSGKPAGTYRIHAALSDPGL